MSVKKLESKSELIAAAAAEFDVDVKSISTATIGYKSLGKSLTIPKETKFSRSTNKDGIKATRGTVTITDADGKKEDQSIRLTAEFESFLNASLVAIDDFDVPVFAFPLEFDKFKEATKAFNALSKEEQKALIDAGQKPKLSMLFATSGDKDKRNW